MSTPDVNRRFVLAGGLSAGGGLLLAACDTRAHPSEAPSSRHPSGPATTSATPHPTATPVPTVAIPRTPEQLTAKLDAYRHSRDGTFSVTLYDRRNRSTFQYRSGWHNQTLSTLKVLIVAAVLRRCQERRVSLTAKQIADVRAAITRSDNDAAEDLLAWVGRAEVQRVAGLYGMTGTVIQDGTEDGQPDWWGYSTSTADDMLRLLNGVVWGSPVITTANSNYLKSLMTQVIPAQRWGVCAPPLPATAKWTTKNGWGGRLDGYRANSIGHIAGNGRDYSAAILCKSRYDPDYYAERDYAFATVNTVSRILYDAMERPLS